LFHMSSIALLGFTIISVVNPLRLTRPSPQAVCQSLSSEREHKLCHGGCASPRPHRAILITGIGSSGTHSIRQLLSVNGIDVGHEVISTFGAVSWLHAVDFSHSDSATWPAPRTANVFFEHIVHLVRCPVDTISSMSKALWNGLGGAPRRLIDNYMDMSELSPGIGHAEEYEKWVSSPAGVKWRMEAWLRWNEHIEGYASDRFRIDQFKDIFSHACSVVKKSGSNVNCSAAQLPDYHENAGDHISLTWEVMKDVDAQLANTIHAKAMQYGFDKSCTEDSEVQDHHAAGMIRTSSSQIGTPQACYEQNVCFDDSDDLAWYWRPGSSL